MSQAHGRQGARGRAKAMEEATPVTLKRKSTRTGSSYQGAMGSKSRMSGTADPLDSTPSARAKGLRTSYLLNPRLYKDLLTISAIYSGTRLEVSIEQG